MANYKLKLNNYKFRGGTRLSSVVENVSRVPTLNNIGLIKLDKINLFNHLGNGGSFTLNANKTITVSVTLNTSGTFTQYGGYWDSNWVWSGYMKGSAGSISPSSLAGYEIKCTVSGVNACGGYLGGIVGFTSQPPYTTLKVDSVAYSYQGYSSNYGYYYKMNGSGSTDPFTDSTNKGVTFTLAFA